MRCSAGNLPLSFFYINDADYHINNLQWGNSEQSGAFCILQAIYDQPV
jgi:hypothetical protein